MDEERTIKNWNYGRSIPIRSKLHHLICTVGVEKTQAVKIRPISTIEELAAINKQDAKRIVKPNNK